MHDTNVYQIFSALNLTIICIKTSACNSTTFSTYSFKYTALAAFNLVEHQFNKHSEMIFLPNWIYFVFSELFYMICNFNRKIKLFLKSKAIHQGIWIVFQVCLIHMITLPVYFSSRLFWRYLHSCLLLFVLGMICLCIFTLCFGFSWKFSVFWFFTG